MSVSSDFLLAALLQHNYLPGQREKRDELPPVFTSESFTPQLAKELCKLKLQGNGHDCVEYRTTKFDLVSRAFGIPHPLPYAQLAFCIHDNWERMNGVCDSDVSMIRPEEHTDGRIIIMDYESFVARSARQQEMAFGRRYVARTDISSCFPSMYSHAIPWAAVGMPQAKKAKGDKKAWFNKLDYHLRMTQRGETLGLQIGPASSNIFAEMILQCTDAEMADAFPKAAMHRFIDDYTFCCDSHDTATKFILDLEHSLSKFRLRLNPKKTVIQDMTLPMSDVWASEMALRLPAQSPVNGFRALNFLEYATAQSREFPRGSVLKYALKALVAQELDDNAKRFVLDYALVLAETRPFLLPLLESLLDDTVDLFGGVRFPERIKQIVAESARRRRADGMVWGLYFLGKHQVNVPKELAQSVLETEDCMSVSALLATGQHDGLVAEWAKGLKKGDLYDLDRYWLLLYQLHRLGYVNQHYSSSPEAFELLAAHSATFIQWPPNENATITISDPLF